MSMVIVVELLVFCVSLPEITLPFLSASIKTLNDKNLANQIY